MNFKKALKKHKLLIIIAAVIPAAIILYLFNPSTSKIFPPCPFKFLTGYYCPGCGSLRALHQLFHGNLIAALKLNSFMVLCIPLMIYLILSEMKIKIKGRRLFPRIVFSQSFYTIFLTIIILYWILRNIPIPPFIYLAPHL
ncbi:MAG: DUF2752 domain-containing protein [Bacillota bacterium]|nr:DUF2752 domain-containing protein [Bacillota bacterium]